MAATPLVGILGQVAIAVVVGVFLHAVLVPALRGAIGRGRRRKRSTLDRLERIAEAQPAVRIVIGDADGERAIDGIRLVGARAGKPGQTLLECIHDDGRTIWLDTATIRSIDELSREL